jgi:hypothetical protein
MFGNASLSVLAGGATGVVTGLLLLRRARAKLQGNSHDL